MARAFSPPVFSITITGDGNGSAAASLDGKEIEEAEAGETVTLTAEPSEGYEFSRWTSATIGVSFKDAQASTTTFTMPKGDVAIGAEFKSEENPTENYTIIVTSGSKGTAVATDLDGNEIEEAKAGDTVALSANAYNGYEFSKWTSPSAGVSFGDATKASTTAGNVNITAEFKTAEQPVKKYSITFAAVTGGSAKALVGGREVEEAEAGSTVTVTAAADADYEFVSWTSGTNGVIFRDAQLATTTRMSVSPLNSK